MLTIAWKLSISSRSTNLCLKYSYTCASIHSARKATGKLKQINENDDHCEVILAECETEIEDDKTINPLFFPLHTSSNSCAEKFPMHCSNFVFSSHWKSEAEDGKSHCGNVLCVRHDNGFELMSFLFWNLRSCFFWRHIFHSFCYRLFMWETRPKLHKRQQRQDFFLQETTKILNFSDDEKTCKAKTATALKSKERWVEINILVEIIEKIEIKTMQEYYKISMH